MLAKQYHSYAMKGVHDDVGHPCRKKTAFANSNWFLLVSTILPVVVFLSGYFDFDYVHEC